MIKASCWGISFVNGYFKEVSQHFTIIFQPPRQQLCVRLLYNRIGLLAGLP